VILCSWCEVDEKHRDGAALYVCLEHTAEDATEGHLNGGGILDFTPLQRRRRQLAIWLVAEDAMSVRKN
jgi:hypothetical protein